MKRFKRNSGLEKVHYAGIGSHDTPQNILDLMEDLGLLLGKENYILRSGASPGADTAFEVGAKKAETDFEIFLPWDKFQNRAGENYMNTTKLANYKKAEQIARNNHYDFDSLSNRGKKLIIRDTYQVLGADLKTPSKFVVCWTPDGCITDRDRSPRTGGTGQAISIASKRQIPIFNLKLKEHKRQIEEWVNKLN